MVVEVHVVPQERGASADDEEPAAKRPALEANKEQQPQFLWYREAGGWSSTMNLIYAALLKVGCKESGFLKFASTAECDMVSRPFSKFKTGPSAPQMHWSLSNKVGSICIQASRSGPQLSFSLLFPLCRVRRGAACTHGNCGQLYARH